MRKSSAHVCGSNKRHHLSPKQVLFQKIEDLPGTINQVFYTNFCRCPREKKLNNVNENLAAKP